MQRLEHVAAPFRGTWVLKGAMITIELTRVDGIIPDAEKNLAADSKELASLAGTARK